MAGGTDGEATSVGTLTPPYYPNVQSSSLAGGLWTDLLVNSGNKAPAGAYGTGTVYPNLDGMDLVWAQMYLQSNMAYIEAAMVNIEVNTNLTDEEKMFSLQMASEAYDEEGLTRTAIMKGIDDLLKTIARNCG